MRRILYLTIVDLSRVDNGGGLACRNHVYRISEVEGAKLTVCTFGTAPDRQNQERAFVRGLSASYRPINGVFNEEVRLPRWPFMMEAHALRQPNIDREVAVLLNEVRPDVVVVDYLFSALFVPSVFRSDKFLRILVQLNDEVDFFRDYQKRVTNLPDMSTSFLAEIRLRYYERKLLRRCAGVVALTKDCLPPPRLGLRSSVICPVFDPSADRWDGERNDDLFFVGNVGHFPNRKAVAWIINALAPALLSAGCTSNINIVGATQDDFSTFPSNVRLLGRASDEEVASRFLSCGMFIAPLVDRVGIKMKLLDCLSKATPFAASQDAMTGIPVEGIPIIEINNATKSAHMLRDYLARPQERRNISDLIASQIPTAIAQQRAAWADIINA